MYMATSHRGYVSAPPGGLTTGRSISRAATLTRVATRSAGGDALVDGGASDGMGGKVMSGVIVAAVDGARLGDALGSGSAVTGVVSDRTPPARAATPSAVSRAGRRRMRIRSARSEERRVGKEC